LPIYRKLPSGRGFNIGLLYILRIKVDNKKEDNYNILNDFPLSLGRGGLRA
jgi:hypothetical protein